MSLTRFRILLMIDPVRKSWRIAQIFPHEIQTPWCLAFGSIWNLYPNPLIGHQTWIQTLLSSCRMMIRIWSPIACHFGLGLGSGFGYGSDFGFGCGPGFGPVPDTGFQSWNQIPLHVDPAQRCS